MSVKNTYKMLLWDKLSQFCDKATGELKSLLLLSQLLNQEQILIKDGFEISTSSFGA